MSVPALLLGLVVAALVLAVIRDGKGGAATWLKAKFLGETPDAA